MRPITDYQVYIVQPGEGTWSIAAKLAPWTVGTDAFMPWWESLAALNGYPAVVPGQALLVDPAAIPAEPEPSLRRPLLGAYLGSHNENPDSTYHDLCGVWPDMMSTYYQASGVGGGTINRQAENQRINRGTIPVITVTARRGPFTHAQIAAGDADAWIAYWANEIAALDDGEVWFTFDQEFEVKVNQSSFAWSPTDAEYAAAADRFHAAVKAARPSVKILYWYGYSDTVSVESVGSKLTFRPDIITLDPYVWAHTPTSTTFAQMCQPKLDWLRDRTWFDGQPIVLSEFGKDTAHGDASLAEFYSGLRDGMEALGLAGAMIFSRNSDSYSMDIFRRDGYPQARAAFTASAADR